MPDGRFLSKSIAWSEQVHRVSLEADYLFMRMIPHLDREGRISGSAKALKAMTCPLRDEITPATIERALTELAEVGLIVRYEGPDGGDYVSMPGFSSHQRGARLDREAPSRIPPPVAVSARRQRSKSARSRTNSGEGPEQVRVSKEKRSEEKRSEGAPAAIASDPGSLGDINGQHPRPPDTPAVDPPPREEAAPPNNWPARISDVLAARGIKASPGKVGGMLDVAVHAFTAPRVIRALEGFLDNGVSVWAQKPEFVTLEQFAKNPGEWVEKITPLNQRPKADRERAMRAAAGAAP